MDEQDQNGDGAANQPDLAGYPSVEALAQAYRQSGAEAKRLKAEADAYRQRVDELQRPAIPQRPRPEEYFQQIGVEPDQLQALVDQRLNQALAPITRGFEARNRVVARMPDYSKHEAEIAQWIQEDPARADAYNRAFMGGDPALAMEWAALSYSHEKRKSTRNARDDQQQDAAHGAIPTNRQGDSRRSPNEGYDAAVNKARERYEQTGSRQDAESYARLRLHKIVSEEHLNQ